MHLLKQLIDKPKLIESNDINVEVAGHYVGDFLLFVTKMITENSTLINTINVGIIRKGGCSYSVEVFLETPLDINNVNKLSIANINVYEAIDGVRGNKLSEITDHEFVNMLEFIIDGFITENINDVITKLTAKENNDATPYNLDCD